MKGDDGGETRPARKRNAWHRCHRKNKSEKPLKSASSVPQSRLAYHARRNVLLTLALPVLCVVGSQASLEVISHSQHSWFREFDHL